MQKHRRIFAALTAAMLAGSASGVSAAATVPPAYFHHSYESFDEMEDMLPTTFTQELIETIDAEYYAGNEGGFEAAISLWLENGVPVPCMDGEPMKSRNDENSVNFYISDLFELPALYYHPENDGWSYIVMQYLDEAQAELAEKNGIRALMDSLSPGAVYDGSEDISLNIDGKATEALLGRTLDDERSYFHFVCGNLLIKAACIVSPEQAPDDFFGELSFERAQGSLAVVDAVALQKYLLCGRTLEKAQHRKLDVTNDGVVNAFDLALVKRKLIAKQALG